MRTLSPTATAVILILAGAGIGAVVAELIGVSSWLDAKLYLACGALFGGAIASLLLWGVEERD